MTRLARSRLFAEILEIRDSPTQSDEVVNHYFVDTFGLDADEVLAAAMYAAAISSGVNGASPENQLRALDIRFGMLIGARAAVREAAGVG